MADTENSETPPEGWPRCEPEQVQVMLLGTYHMDNPGLDEVNVNTDDVLADDRQGQLQNLVDHLADWEPDRIAIERPYDEFEAVNDLYEKYRSGEYAYGREETFPAPHPMRNDNDSECRSEVVQVGFRLADRLNHELIYPIDYPIDISNDDLQILEQNDFRPDKKVSFPALDLEEFQHEVDERLATSAIPEYLHWVNQEERVRITNEGMFARYLRWGEGDNYGGPQTLAKWYDRNLRMAHNLWRALEQGDERMLLIVGFGHVRALHHLLNEAPMFCPVSPLPYL
jgi:hypothetical protein